MAEQATGAVEATSATAPLAYSSGHMEHNPGRPMSWVAVTVVIVGFIIGGIAFVPGPHWVLFWVGAGVAVVGCFMTLFTKTFSQDWY